MTDNRSRIMVVDDDTGLLHVISRILGRQHEMLCLSEPHAALQQAGEFGPDLAILDIYMPEVSGFELMQSLRAKCRGVDIIVMTGDTAEPDKNLVRAIDEGAFYFLQKPFERRVLQTLVGRCLELRRLKLENQRQLLRMKRELSEARQFQLSFLPPARAELGRVRIASRFLSCQELAGDFFDYAVGSAGRVGWIVADVVGHGASAALMTVVIKSAFRNSASQDFHPAEVIRQLQAGLGAFEDCRFVTVFCGQYDPGQKKSGQPNLAYVNAGHPPPILRRREGAPDLLEATGSVVCPALAGIPIEVAQVAVQPGDVLLAYTDGLAEAEGAKEMYGHGRIRSVITRSAQSDEVLLQQLMDEWSEFRSGRPYKDDVTVLAVEFD